MMDIRDLACFLIGIVFFLGGSPSIVRNASATPIHHKNNSTAESTQDKSYTIIGEDAENELNSVRNVLRPNEVVPSSVGEVGPEARGDAVTSLNEGGAAGERALGAIYTECLVQLSYACAQRKMLVYVSHLAARDNISLFGDSLTLVRVGRGQGALHSDEEHLEARMEDVDVSALLDHTIEVFLRSRALRLRLPSWSTIGVAATGMSRAGSAIDISISQAMDEGRGKKGGMKGGMKMAGMMMKMLMIGKGMMVPVMMGMTKFMAMKGLMMGMMSLMMSKMMILAKLKKGGGGGGGGGGGWPMMGGGGGGGGGWPMMGGGSGGWSMGGGGGGGGGSGGDWSGGGGGGGGD